MNNCFHTSLVFLYLVSCVVVSFVLVSGKMSLNNLCFYRSGIGVCGDNQTIFYAEVTDKMKTGKGKEECRSCLFIIYCL